MKKRTKINVLSVVMLTLFITVLLSLGAFTLSAHAAKVIKVGVMLPFTGTMADYGPLCKLGIETYMEEVGYKVAGKQIKLIFEDSGTDASVALEKAKKLVVRDGVKIIIGPPNSGAASGIAPYLAQNKVICFGFLNHPLEMREKGVVKTYPQTLYAAGMPLGWYAYDKLGYRKVVSLGCDYVAGHRFVGGSLATFEERGGKVLQKKWAPPGTVDFGPYLVSMDKSADAVIVWTISGDLLRFIKQYNEFGLKMPVLISTASSLKTNYLEELGDIVLGIVGGAEYTWKLDNPQNKKFVKAFESKHGIKPEKDHASSYVAASVVVAALEATGGNTNYKKLDKAINSLKMDTIQGPLYFTSDGIAVTNRYITVAKKENGRYFWDPVFTYEAVRDSRE